MALVARPVIVPPSLTVTSSRPATAARGGSLAGPVESLSPSSGALLSDETFSTVINFGWQDQPDHSFMPDRRGGSDGRRNGGENTPSSQHVPSIGIIESTTESFAMMVELRDSPIPQIANVSDTPAGRSTKNVINRAVSLYESSVNMLANPQNVRGETFSFSL